MLWAPDETALDLFARQAPRRFRTGLRFLDAPVAGAGDGDGGGYQPRQVVELCGPSAGPPKAEILLHVAAAFLALDARARVFLLDHEHEASARRLVDILVDRAQAQGGRADAAARTEAREAAARVVVGRCRDTAELLATLNQVHCRLLGEAPARERRAAAASRVHWRTADDGVSVSPALLLLFNSIGSFRAIDKVTPALLLREAGGAVC